MSLTIMTEDTSLKLQAVHSRHDISLVADSLIGLVLLVIWLYWKNGLIQASYNSFSDSEKVSVIAAFFILTPVLLDIGLSWGRNSLLLGSLLSAIITLTTREIFAYQKAQEEVKAEIVAELQANIRSIKSIEKNYHFLSSLTDGNTKFDDSWPKSLKVVWKNVAMRKYYTTAIAQRIFPVDALQKVEELYSIIEILTLKAEAGVDGYVDFEEAFPLFLITTAALLDAAQDLGIGIVADEV